MSGGAAMAGSGSDTSSDSDTSSSSSSGSDSSSDVDAPTLNALYRSYLKFTVSQDPHNQSFLSRSQFAQLDLYQTDALRDNDDPLGLSREMQGATRHFPCHVFWSKELGSGKYAVWGRSTVGQHEQEAVIHMLEAQRQERQEYAQLVNARKWQRECERKVREGQLASSAFRAEQRARTRRASDVPNVDPSAEEAPAPATGRIASIVHRIVRRESDARLTEAQAASEVNRGLRRLGMKALAVGSLALVSAVTYLQLLQTQPEEAGEAFGILATPPDLAAHAGASSSSVTDRVFAAHEARLARKPVRE